MKQHLVLWFFLILSNIMNGQEFIFEMYFEDAIGNKDTLVIGYDINATDSIDSVFGEKNIISVPLDSLFDVRMTDVWLKKSSAPIPSQEYGSFHTKKQIVVTMELLSQAAFREDGGMCLAQVAYGEKYSRIPIQLHLLRTSMVITVLTSIISMEIATQYLIFG